MYYTHSDELERKDLTTGLPQPILKKSYTRSHHRFCRSGLWLDFAALEIDHRHSIDIQLPVAFINLMFHRYTSRYDRYVTWAFWTKFCPDPSNSAAIHSIVIRTTPPPVVVPVVVPSNLRFMNASEPTCCTATYYSVVTVPPNLFNTERWLSTADLNSSTISNSLLTYVCKFRHSAYSTVQVSFRKADQSPESLVIQPSCCSWFIVAGTDPSIAIFNCVAHSEIEVDALMGMMIDIMGFMGLLVVTTALSLK